MGPRTAQIAWSSIAATKQSGGHGCIVIAIEIAIEIGNDAKCAGDWTDTSTATERPIPISLAISMSSAFGGHEDSSGACARLAGQ